MRLLIPTPDFPPGHGGVQVLVHRLAVELADLEPLVLAPDAPGAAEFDRTSGVAIRRVPVGRLPSQGRAAALNAAALAVGLRSRPDAVLSAHIVASPAALAIRRRWGSRVVQYFHANEIVGKPRLAGFAARSADAVVAVSSYSEQLIRATGAAPRELRLIPPGVDIPRERTPLPCERPTMLTVARLNNSYKGHDVVIEALPAIRRAVPEVRWVVIGDGPMRAELEALARARGVADAVSFLGAVPDAERDEWLRRAHLFVMPSRLPGGGLAGEGFGIVYMEASSYGKPVLAGAVGGALDAVVDGETGLLVDPTDAAAVAAAASRLLLDSALAERLGEAGAERSREFAWPLVAARVRALLVDPPGARAGEVS